MKKDPNKNRQERLEDYLDAVWDGGKAGLSDFSHVVFHPIDTATDSAQTVLSLMQDTLIYASGPTVFNQNLYDNAAQRMQARDAGFRQMLINLHNAKGAEYVYSVTRLVFGGMGTAAGAKVLKVLKKISTHPKPSPGYYDNVREYAQKYSKYDPDIAFESADMFERLPGLKELVKQGNTLQANARQTAFNVGVVYGAADKHHSKQTSFSFINDAKAEESKPHEEAKQQETKAGKEQHQETPTRETIKQNLQVDDENLDIIMQSFEALQKKITFDEQVQAGKEFFMDLGYLGEKIGNPHLSKIGAVGFNCVRINENLAKLQTQFPQLQGLVGLDSIFGNFLSGFSMLQPHMAVITSVVSIAMNFLGKTQADPSMVMNMEYFKAILSSLFTIRKEMHERFDELTFEVRDLKVHMEINYFKLKHLIQMHSQIGLKNLNKVQQDLGEDVQQVEHVLSSLIKRAQLTTLDSLLVYLNTEVTESELKKITTEVPLIWLLKELVSHNYNGGIYTSDSKRQDAHFIGKEALEVSSALGFLANYDRELFGNIDTNKLPLVPVWIYTLDTYLQAKLIARKSYNKQLDLKHLSELKAVVENTLHFVQTAADKSPDLLQKLGDKYTNALDALYAQLVLNFAEELKTSDQEYSLKSLLDKKILSLEKLEQKLGKSLVNQITTNPRALETNIPLIAALSCQLQVADCNVSAGSYQITPPYVRAEDKCSKGKRWLNYYTFGSTGNFDVQIKPEEKIVKLGSGTYGNGGRRYYQECHHRDSVEGYAISADGQIKNTHAARAIHSILAESSTPSYTANTDSQSTLNGLVPQQIAEHILEKLKSGQSFSDFLDVDLVEAVAGIYSRAVTATLDDLKSNEGSINTLAITPKLAQAYGILIGLPTTVLDSFNQFLPANAEYVLNRPSLFKLLPDSLPQLQTTVAKNLPFRVSAIENQMLSALDSITNHEMLVLFDQAYQENLAEWKENVASFHQQLTQIQHMEQLDLLPEQDISVELYQFYVVLQLQYQQLLSAHATLSELTDVLEAPLSVDEFLSQLQSPPTANKRAGMPPTKVGFSFTKAAQYIDDQVHYIRQQPCQTEPASVIIGGSGVSKSTLTNFLHGTDYALTYDDAGQDYVTPCNDVPEITPTGVRKSITKKAQFIRVNNKVYVDLPGYFDDEGIEVDIARAFQIGELPKLFTKIKAIQLVVTHNDLYKGRFDSLAKTFREAGLIIANSPEENAKHILLTVSKPNANLLAKLQGDLKAYQKLVFNQLLTWYEESIISLEPDDLNYPIKYALENIRVENIVIVDVTNSTHRLHYQQALDKLPTAVVENFSLNRIDKDAELLKEFMHKLDAHQQAIQAEIDHKKQMLAAFWTKQSNSKKPDPVSNFGNYKSHELMQDLVLCESMQQTQFNLHQRIAQTLNQNPTSSTIKMDANSEAIVASILSLQQELNEIKPLIDRFENLINEPEEVFYEVEEETYFECSSSSWSFPPVACAQTTTTPKIAASQTPKYTADIQYTGTIDGLIYLGAWFIHAISKQLPWHQERAITDDELLDLRNQKQQVKKLQKNIASLGESILYHPHLIAGRIDSLQRKCGHLINDIEKIKRSKLCTDANLQEITSELQKIKDGVTTIQVMQNKINRFQQTIPEGNVLVLNYNIMTNDIECKHETETAYKKNIEKSYSFFQPNTIPERTVRLDYSNLQYVNSNQTQPNTSAHILT